VNNPWISNFQCMKFLKTDSLHPVQSHGKLVSDNESGKKRGAIIHANEITDGFQKVSKGFQNPSNRRPPATRPSLSQWPSPSPSPIPSPSPPQHRFHIPHFSTTLPPLVQVSALPKLVRQTHGRIITNIIYTIWPEST
jgi:hypothetical protein